MVKKRIIKTVILLVLLAVGWGTLSAADVEFPLIQSMTYFPYRDNTTLFKNQWRLSLDMYYSNVYMYDVERTTVNDMELLTNTLAAGYGLSDRLTLELYYRFGVAFGGILDDLIVNFHDIFGLREGGRNDYPRNQVNYSYKDAFSYDGGTAFQSPVILGVLGNLYRGEYVHLNARLALGLPLASRPGFTSNKSFMTLGLILLYKKNQFSLDFSSHLSFFKNPSWLAGEDMTPRIFQSGIRIDYRKFFAGFLYRGTPFRGGDLSNAAYQVYLGIRFLKSFEFAFIEEFPPVDTTPDVTFNLKINLLKQ